MKYLIKFIFSFLVLTVSNCFAQSISTSIPEKIKKSEKYLFYVHGRIIEEQGIHAVHPDMVWKILPGI